MMNAIERRKDATVLNIKMQVDPLLAPAQLIGNLAYNALLLEVALHPKPGLVTALSNGAHQDMNIMTFQKSAQAILPFLIELAQVGYHFDGTDLSRLLVQIRPIGIKAEASMFKATHNVNTHKGAIFILGVLAAAMGYLMQHQQKINARLIQHTIQTICKGMTSELSQGIANTHGRKVFTQYGLKGIRGEAESGFPTIMSGLSRYQQARAVGHDDSHAMYLALLTCMAINSDSCLVKRGGLAGLAFVRQRAAGLLRLSLNTCQLRYQLERFNHQCVQRNLSPGGSADCLSAIWFIAQIEHLTSQQ